jgi:hypothetical protein
MAGAAALAFLFSSSGIANASISYTLSGNGIFSYSTSSNNLAMQDVKTGDFLYTLIAYTNTVCGNYDNACAPSNWSRIYANSPNPHTEYHLLSPGTKDYVLLRFCQDDTPPDTCSQWKRVQA